jgi:hypothetical protein
MKPVHNSLSIIPVEDEQYHLYNEDENGQLVYIDVVYVVYDIRDDETEYLIGVYSNESDIEQYIDNPDYEVTDYIFNH